MAALQENSSKTKLSGGDKLIIVGLLCLEVPLGLFFIPLAAVLVLTGILAPLGVMSFAFGTLPLSLALKRKSKAQSIEVQNDQWGENAKVQPAP